LNETESRLLQKMTDVTYYHISENPTPIVVTVSKTIPRAVENLNTKSLQLLLSNLLLSNRTIFEQSIVDTFKQYKGTKGASDPIFIGDFHNKFSESLKKYVLPK